MSKVIGLSILLASSLTLADSNPIPPPLCSVQKECLVSNTECAASEVNIENGSTQFSGWASVFTEQTIVCVAYNGTVANYNRDNHETVRTEYLAFDRVTAKAGCTGLLSARVALLPACR